MKKILQQIKWVILVFPLFLNNSCGKVSLNATDCLFCGPFGPSGPYTCSSCVLYNIGDTVYGGKVAYIFKPTDPGWNSDRQTGLIVAMSDQSTGADWGCAGTRIYGADSTALNTGKKNSSYITTYCLAPGIAARICDDLDLAGYKDWYLPSKDELNKIYENRAIIGGFVNNTYWSSSQSGSNNAWSQNFSDGAHNTASKNNIYYVRAVRTY